MKSSSLLTAALISLLGIPTHAYAGGRIFVDDNAPTGGGGESWSTAYRYLQDALAAARNSGGSITEIWVAAGLYKSDRDTAHPTGTGSRTATFQLISGVALRGGFAGTEDPATCDLATRDFRANQSILSGDLAGNDGPDFTGNAENSYHVLTAAGTDVSALLEGFVVSGGNADAMSVQDGYGAGMNGAGGSPTVINCMFNGNRATSGGGAIMITGPQRLIDCTFTGNSGTFGGAIYSGSGNPVLVNCTLWGNVARAGDGGAIGSEFGRSVTLVNSILWGNIGSQIFGSASVSYSCIQGGWTGPGNTSTDPRLLFVVGGNLRLRRGSPCIDAGSNDPAAASIDYDMGGSPRFVDDPETPDSGNGGDLSRPLVDMGAYEYQPAPFERLYVNGDSAPGGDGTSWTRAHRHLQDAFRAAQMHAGVTEIWVAGGCYQPDRDSAHPEGTRDRTAVLQLPGGVGVYGGFPGQPGQEGQFSVRNPVVYQTMLSGDLAGDDGPGFTNNGENSYHVVAGSGAGPTAILDGFTVSRGNANGSSSDSFGGGMYNAIGYPQLVHCIFRGNSATLDGGGMYNLQSSPALTDCTFSGNLAVRMGGGMANTYSTSTLTNCTVAGNLGGGVFNDIFTPTLINCIIWDNDRFSMYGAATVTYSCIEAAWTGEGNISINPSLISAANGNLRLRRGSACIDAGSNATVPAGLTRDLDGNSRLVDDPGTPDSGNAGSPPRPIVDMGAYEYQPVPPEWLFVSAGAAPGGDGASWSTAYRYLQDALASLQTRGAVTEIWVAAGVYKPDRDEAHAGGTGDRAATFQVVTGVAVRGGFAGNEDPATFNLADRDFHANLTVLNGDLAGDDGANFANNGENSYRVVTTSGVGPTAALDGFTVSGGNASRSGDFGGGLYNNFGRPLIANCTFTGNSSAWYGGGMHSTGNATLIRCTFHGNSSSQYGGGLSLSSNSSSLTECVFVGNSASQGGGIYSGSSSPVLMQCVFSGNSAVSGGAIGIDNTSSAVLSNCTLSGNSASMSGGGIYTYTNAVHATLTNCIVVDNSGAQMVGAINATYSCVQGGWTGQGNIGDHPRLMTDLRLRRGSPCIDAGDNAGISPGMALDLEGNSRFVDDPDTQDLGNPGNPPRPVVDMGAFEYQPALAERLYVDNDAAPGGSGESWVTACRNLQDALSTAAVRPWVTEIWVAAGIYRPDRDALHPSGTADRASTFQLTTGVSLYGGFAGNEDAAGFDLHDRDFQAHPTVLSGDLAGNDGPGFADNAENSRHVVTATGVGPAALLDGFTISGGNADGESPHNCGGGIYATGGSATVSNCVFSGNSASLDGGGMWSGASGNPSLVACTFSENLAVRDGGGMCNALGSPGLTACTFGGNTATRSGGGMWNGSANNPVLTACRFSGNSATIDGGGMYNGSGNPQLTECAFRENSAARYGGGMYNSSTGSALTGCLFGANMARSGGGLYIVSGAVSLTGCVFTGNSASLVSPNSGGGVSSTSSSPTFINCRIDRNSAYRGAGVYLSAGTPKLLNCTISANSATQGSGLYHTSNSPTLTNCIVWGNVGSQITGSATATYSCIQGGWTGKGNINKDPAFVSATAGDFRLGAGSPSIDAGQNAAVPAGVNLDLDGHLRLLNDPVSADCRYAPGTCGTAPIVDMGAYEFMAGDFDRDGDLDLMDLLAFQACISGPAIPFADGCLAMDFDHDGDADQEDFGFLQGCYSGVNKPVDSSCMK